ERLTKKMEYIKTIDDKDRRFTEMSKIKDAIDEVYHSEIKLLVEQANQLTDKQDFEQSFKNFERAMTINEMIENSVLKNKVAIKYEYKHSLIKKAKLEIENNQFEVAIADCNKALELDNRFVKAFFYIGIAYINKKDYASAINFFKKSLDLDAQHSKSWNFMGFSYEKQADFDNAIDAYKKAIEFMPSYAQAYFNMGNAYKYKEQYDKAIESYIKATEINPEFSNAWFFMGVAYFDNKQYNEAMKMLDKAIQLEPKLGVEITPVLENLKSNLKKLENILINRFLNQ
ncbi:MAG: tetratricopeptide repeat protein, partial [Candidatus Thorarchaeota archaeon]